MFKNMYLTEQTTNSIHNLLTGSLKNIRMYWDLYLEITESVFLVILCNFFKINFFFQTKFKMTREYNVVV